MPVSSPHFAFKKNSIATKVVHFAFKKLHIHINSTHKTQFSRTIEQMFPHELDTIQHCMARLRSQREESERLHREHEEWFRVHVRKIKQHMSSDTLLHDLVWWRMALWFYGKEKNGAVPSPDCAYCREQYGSLFASTREADA